MKKARAEKRVNAGEMSHKKQNMESHPKWAGILVERICPIKQSTKDHQSQCNYKTNQSSYYLLSQLIDDKLNSQL
jgi:hypothetical protein